MGGKKKKKQGKKKKKKKTGSSLLPHIKKKIEGTSLVVQWLRICLVIQGSTGSISGWGTKIPHAVE